MAWEEKRRSFHHVQLDQLLLALHESTRTSGFAKFLVQNMQFWLKEEKQKLLTINGCHISCCTGTG